MRSTLFALSFGIGLGVTAASAVPPTVHVTWAGLPGPLEDFDYFIDDTDPDFPNVELVRERLTWRIWSTDQDNPGGVGDIGVISSPHGADYGVTLEDDFGGAGARDVKGIDLDPTNDIWNYSQLNGGSISGNLIGDMFLQTSFPGSGGTALGFTIEGNVSGNIDLRRGVGFTIQGNAVGNITMVDGSGFTIGGAYG